ncbi:hypothetical protein ACZ90_43445 [Streptomyces albus subsp. albus]|nr:hypothetical protein ACZ90_43445 [Streptomyces albus subsp. albus]
MTALEDDRMAHARRRGGIGQFACLLCVDGQRPLGHDVLARVQCGAAAVAVRKAGEAALRGRLGQADDLPPGYTPADLAALVHTISDGIAVQAAAGRTRDELSRVAETALRALLG